MIGPVAALVVAGALAAFPAMATAQPPVPDLHASYDRLLDTYVRDGLVYYRALKSDRRALDAYVAALDGPAAKREAAGTRDQQIALWVNAYNALVLRTVIDRYPIRGGASDVPSNSIRQVPGAFERVAHRVAGRSLTLDAIEREVLAGFKDPRLFLALGRGSVGGGRLRSEAFAAARLEEQLRQVEAEVTTRRHLVRVNPADGELAVTPLFSWHGDAFADAYAARADQRFAGRSPLERGIVALIGPHLLPAEREFLERNTFRLVFLDYDWRLNDLTGGAPR